MKSKSGRDKAKLNIRLNHQVNYGEHVVISGSAKEMGSWSKDVPMNWTENGWVLNLEFDGDTRAEFKFVIVSNDESKRWENGDNRVVKLPKRGTYEVICHWDRTGENLGLSASDELEDVGANGSTATTAEITEESGVVTSPFVGQWQGKAASFMRSNEHRDHESARKWDTSGLEGLALKLVEGDRNARNWWRKVLRSILILSWLVRFILSRLKVYCLFYY